MYTINQKQIVEEHRQAALRENPAVFGCSRNDRTISKNYITETGTNILPDLKRWSQHCIGFGPESAESVKLRCNKSWIKLAYPFVSLHFEGAFYGLLFSARIQKWLID